MWGSKNTKSNQKNIQPRIKIIVQKLTLGSAFALHLQPKPFDGLVID